MQEHQTFAIADCALELPTRAFALHGFALSLVAPIGEVDHGRDHLPISM